MRSDYTFEQDGVMFIGNQFLEISIEIYNNLHLSELVNKTTGKTLCFSASSFGCVRVAGGSDGLHDAERCSAGNLILEKNVSVGSSFYDVSLLRLLDHSLTTCENHTEAAIRTINDQAKIAVNAYFRVNSEDPIITKQLVVQNIGKTERTLLELDIQRLQTHCAASVDEQGNSCFIEDEVFFGVHHSSSTVHIVDGTISLTSFPRCTLLPGEYYESEIAVFGVAEHYSAMCR